MKMMNKMIVTIKDFGDTCISIQVFDREQRNSQNFLILKRRIKNEFFVNGFMNDTDINNTLHLAARLDDFVECRINFMDIDAANHITGYRRIFKVPYTAFEEVLNGVNSKILVDFEEQEHTPQFILTDSVHRVVGMMDKVKRRAFVKALTSNFCNDDTVTISKDFGEDFFFEEKSQSVFSPVCGGLCLHKSEVRGKDGLFSDKLSYSKHT